MTRRRGEGFLRLMVQVDGFVYEKLNEESKETGIDLSTIAVIAMHYAVIGKRGLDIFESRRLYNIEVEVTRSFDGLLREIGAGTATVRGQLVASGMTEALQHVRRWQDAAG